MHYWKATIDSSLAANCRLPLKGPAKANRETTLARAAERRRQRADANSPRAMRRTVLPWGPSCEGRKRIGTFDGIRGVSQSVAVM